MSTCTQPEERDNTKETQPLKEVVRDKLVGTSTPRNTMQSKVKYWLKILVAVVIIVAEHSVVESCARPNSNILPQQNASEHKP